MTPIQSDADFTEIRKTTITAMEVAALFESVAEVSGTDQSEDKDEDFSDRDGDNVNPFGSPLSLWELKTGKITSSGGGLRTLWSRIKWGVINAAADQYGFETDSPENVMIHGDIPMMSSMVDAHARGPQDAEWKPLIAKNVNGRMAGTWRNAAGDWTPPEHIILEAQHHMAVRNADAVHVVAFIGDADIQHFRIERDEELIEDITGAIQDFWECVTADRRPRASSSRDAKVLARLNAIIAPDAPPLDLRGSNRATTLLERKSALKGEIKTREKEVEEIDAELKEMMTGYSVALLDGERQIKWIVLPGKDVSYTSKPSAYLKEGRVNAKTAGPGVLEMIEAQSSQMN